MIFDLAFQFYVYLTCFAKRFVGSYCEQQHNNRALRETLHWYFYHHTLFRSVENEENWKSKLMVKAVAWNVSTGSFLVVVYFDKIPIIFLVWQYLNTQKM